MYSIELGRCAVDGYVVQSARSFVVGSPNQTQVNLFETAKHSLDAMLEAVEIGKTGEQLWTVGLEPVTKAGFAPWGRFGHYMGFEFNGPQRINLMPGDQHSLYEGEVVTFHPSIYDTSAGHAGLVGDTILIERNGWRYLSAEPPHYELMSG